MTSPNGNLYPLPPYKEVVDITPPKLGRNELLVLWYLGNIGHTEVKELYQAFCGNAQLDVDRKKCRDLIHHAVNNLKAKGYVVRKRKFPIWMIYLTRKGKMFNAYFYNPIR